MKRITPNTIAILGVHLWGNVCETHKLEKIAQQYQLQIIYDAAHALGSRLQQQQVGGFGNTEIFSFHATKFIHSLEGGAIVTNDDPLAHAARQLINFGYEAGEIQSIGINAALCTWLVSQHLRQSLKKQVNDLRWSKLFVTYCSQFLTSLFHVNEVERRIVTILQK